VLVLALRIRFVFRKKRVAGTRDAEKPFSSGS
jgi:hypothetical protein